MSSGDIDDTLGDAEYLKELRRDNIPFERYLCLAFFYKPIRSFFIPFGAGISEDGRRVYISNDLQSIVQGVECESALVRHEVVEWGLRYFLKIGEDYQEDPRGHRLANRAEHDRVLQLLDRSDAWELYTTIIDPQIMREERDEIKKRAIPRDLALYPYDDEFRDALQLAMWNDISEEEWSKLGA